MSLRRLYDKNTNIMQFFRMQNESNSNTANAIEIAYDFQAGSYSSYYYSDEEKEFIYNGESVKLKPREAYNIRAQVLSKYLQELGEFNSFIDVGAGEATNTYTIIKEYFSKYNPKADILCTDISLSRLLYANKFIHSEAAKDMIDIQNDLTFFSSNMFYLPLADSSVDIVYTHHSIEPNTNKEEEILKELYRVASKYLVLIEPSYELGSTLAKENIEKHSYIRYLKEKAILLGYKILDYKLFEISLPQSGSAIMIIEKDTSKNASKENRFACPNCKNVLTHHNGSLFCNEDFLAFPNINGIYTLQSKNGILVSKFLEF